MGVEKQFLVIVYTFILCGSIYMKIKKWKNNKFNAWRVW